MARAPKNGDAGEAPWAPPFALDLQTASSAALVETIAKLRKWSEENPPPTEPIPGTGWTILTPQMSFAIWRRYKANRKVSLSSVRKYAFEMLAGQWRRNGQPILVDDKGEPQDGFHRTLASFFSGASFPTYIVSDVPADPYGFAFIDIGKPRTAADALVIAGEDGLASVIAGAVKLAWRYDHKALRIIKPPRIREMTNFEIAVFVHGNKSLTDAAHLVAGTYGSAAKTIGNKPVATFFTWKAMELFDDDVLASYLEPLGLGANLPPDSPILAVRDRLRAVPDKQQEKLSDQHRLALLIKAFVMHTKGATVGRKGLSLRDNEPFPRLEDAEVMDIAAE